MGNKQHANEYLAVVVAAISLLMPLGCKNLPDSYDSVDVELVQIRETAHYIFRYSPGDFVHADRMESYHDWAVDFLGVQLPKKIDYFKYRDRAQQIRMTGTFVTGFADPQNFEIHTAEPWIPHEAAHLYFSLIGTAPPFFNEGVAVAMQVDPYNNDYIPREKGGEPVHSIARRFLAEGRLYPVEDILEAVKFMEGDFTIGYIQGGSFVGYIMDAYGIEALKALFQNSGYNDSSQQIKSTFLGVYGRSIADMEQEWLAFLKGL